MTTEAIPVIREATMEDAAAIARVHVDSWRTTYRGVVPDNYLASLSYQQRESDWRRFLSPETPDFYYVVEVEGKGIVGFGGGGPERDGNPDYSGELYGMYLLEQWQRKGLGRRFTALVAERLLGLGFQSMMLWVLARNPAVNFYEALGGRVVTQRSIKLSGVTLDELAYGWDDVSVLLTEGR